MATSKKCVGAAWFPEPSRPGRVLPRLAGLVQALLLVSMLSACSEDLQPPTARIDGPPEGVVGQVVELSGAGSTASEGGTLSYLWSFLEVPGGSQATFNDPRVVNPSFEPDVAGTYIVGLVVREGDLDSVPATLAIEVSVCGSQVPVIASVASVPSDPGAGDPVRLVVDATDPDNGTECNLGQRLTYDWLLRSKPTGSRAALDDASVPSPSLIPDLPGSYEIEVIVSDSTGLQSNVGTLVLEVGVCGAQDPVVNSVAVSPDTPVTGDIVTLSAEFSDPDNSGDCAEDQALTLHWALVGLPAGSAAQMVGPELRAPYFVPDVEGEYVVELVVTDATGRHSEPGQLTVLVEDCGTNEPIVEAIAADPASPNTFDLVELSAEIADPDSSEACGDADLYLHEWQLVTVPAGSEAALSRSDIENPTIRPDVPGDYVIRLDVTDVRGLRSPPASFTLTAAECGAASPDASLESSVESPVVGDTVVVTAQVEDADEWDGSDEDTCRLEQSFEYEWGIEALPEDSTAGLFGQGTPTTGFIPDVPGTYVIVIRVTDSDGHTTETRITIVVADDEAPEADAEARVGDGAFAVAVAGLTPLTVEFRCSSQAGDEVRGEAPFTYRWNLGNGVTTSEQNPIFTYTQGGRFVATCTVTDRNGDVDVDSVTVDAELDTAPRVAISGSPLTGFKPLTAHFTSTVTGGNGALTLTWSWGDGESESGVLGVDTGIEAPSHRFDEQGTYRVVLTVEDADEDIGAANLQVAVGVDSAPAVAVSAQPERGIEPLTVRLQADVAGGDPPLSFSWDLGTSDTAGCGDEGADPDALGCTVRAQNPVHTFNFADDASGPADGLLTARVRVEDADGDVATGEVDFTVFEDTEPAVVITPGTPVSGLSPLLVELTCTAQGGNPPFAFTWDFGDGESSTSQNPTHLYEHGGTYQATCIVTDADGDESDPTAVQSSVTVEVEQDTAPVVALSAEPLAGLAALDVDFEAALVVRGNDTHHYRWSFGDGTTFEGDAGDSDATFGPVETPSYTYEDAGQFEVRVTVTDAQGDVGTDSLRIAVGTDSEPAVVAGAEPRFGVSPLTVGLTADVAGGDPPLTFFWDLDDLDPDTGEPVTSAAQYPVHTYVCEPEAGEPRTCLFSAEVTVTDAASGDGEPPDTDSDTVDIVVEADEPVGAFVGVNPETAADDRGLTPFTVSFTCQSRVDDGTGTDTFVPSGNEPFTYLWDFGDGQTSTLPNPTHTYAAAGDFEARCTVTDADGDVSDADDPNGAVIVYVERDEAPTVAIAADVDDGIAPLEVRFTSSVTGGNGPAPFHYRWELGDAANTVYEGFPGLDDGAFGPLAGPTFTYGVADTHVARLIVTDCDVAIEDGGRVVECIGDSGTDSLPIVVRADRSPAVAATAEPSAGVREVEVQLAADVLDGNPPLTFEWDFDFAGTACDYDGYTDVNDPGACQPDEICRFSQAADAGVCLAADSVQQNPVHTYLNETVGTLVFTAAVVVIDADGDRSDPGGAGASVDVTVAPNQVPTVSVTATPPPDQTGRGLSADNPGLTPFRVAFTCTPTGGDPPYAYRWDFGDGGSSLQKDPIHTYLTGGQFDATCFVLDANDDAEAEGFATIYVEQDVAPVVGLTADPLAGLEVQEVTFFPAIAPGNGDHTFVLDYGDGMPVRSGDVVVITTDPLVLGLDFGPTPDGVADPVQHNYVAGDYVARLTVTDGDVVSPDSAQDTARISVAPDLEAGVVAGADPVFGAPPLTVNFSAAPSGNLPGSFLWDFDVLPSCAGPDDCDGGEACVDFGLGGRCRTTCSTDGNCGGGLCLTGEGDVAGCVLAEAIEQNPVFTYPISGAFSPSVLFTDQDGDDTATDSVRLAVNRPPVSDAGGDQCLLFGGLVLLDACVADSCTVDPASGDPVPADGSFDPEGDDLSFEWQFLARPAGSTEPLNDAGISNPSFRPDAPGVYRLRLTVDDGHYRRSDEVVIEVAYEPTEMAFLSPTGEQTALAGEPFPETFTLRLWHICAAAAGSPEIDIPDWEVTFSGVNVSPTVESDYTGPDGTVVTGLVAGTEADETGALWAAAVGSGLPPLAYPFALNIEPGPAVRLSVDPPTPDPATAGQTMTFTLRTFDRFDNPADTDVEACVSGSAVMVSSVEDPPNCAFFDTSDTPGLGVTDIVVTNDVAEVIEVEVFHSLNIFTDDFESGDDGQWILEQIGSSALEDWELGTPSVGPETDASGATDFKVWGTGIDQSYVATEAGTDAAATVLGRSVTIPERLLGGDPYRVLLAEQEWYEVTPQSGTATDSCPLEGGLFRLNAFEPISGAQVPAINRAYNSGPGCLNQTLGYTGTSAGWELAIYELTKVLLEAGQPPLGPIDFSVYWSLERGPTAETGAGWYVDDLTIDIARNLVAVGEFTPATPVAVVTESSPGRSGRNGLDEPCVPGVVAAYLVDEPGNVVVEPFDVTFELPGDGSIVGASIGDLVSNDGKIAVVTTEGGWAEVRLELVIGAGGDQTVPVLVSAEGFDADVTVDFTDPLDSEDGVCTDGIDNDCDVGLSGGGVDCVDDDCSATVACIPHGIHELFDEGDLFDLWGVDGGPAGTSIAFNPVDPAGTSYDVVVTQEPFFLPTGLGDCSFVFSVGSDECVEISPESCVLATEAGEWLVPVPKSVFGHTSLSYGIDRPGGFIRMDGCAALTGSTAEERLFSGGSPVVAPFLAALPAELSDSVRYDAVELLVEGGGEPQSVVAEVVTWGPEVLLDVGAGPIVAPDTIQVILLSTGHIYLSYSEYDEAAVPGIPDTGAVGISDGNPGGGPVLPDEVDFSALICGNGLCSTEVGESWDTCRDDCEGTCFAGLQDGVCDPTEQGNETATAACAADCEVTVIFELIPYLDTIDDGQRLIDFPSEPPPPDGLQALVSPCADQDTNWPCVDYLPPPLSGGGAVAIVGEPDALGAWIPNQTFLFFVDDGTGFDSSGGDGLWTKEFAFQPSASPIRHKYTIARPDGSDYNVWPGTQEWGGELNRELYLPDIAGLRRIRVQEVFADVTDVPGDPVITIEDVDCNLDATCDPGEDPSSCPEDCPP